MLRPPVMRLFAALARSRDPAYRAAQEELAVRRSVVMLGYLGLAYPSFYALDLVVYPTHWSEFGIIRLLHALLGLGGLTIGRRFLSHRVLLRLAQGGAISATGSVAVMCSVTEGFGSLYVVGMIICFLAISTIEVFRPASLLLTLLGISAAYGWLNWQIGPLEARHAVAATSFVLGSVLFCGVSAALTEQHRRELFAVTADLRTKNADLERARELQGQFLSTVSHELRSPVNSMLGFIELVEARESSLQTKSRANLVRVRESGQRLLRLINDLLDLSKAEAGRMEVHLSTFDLMSVVQEVAEATRALFVHRDLPILVRGPETLSVRSDEQRVRQILTNLASNAAKFTEVGQVALMVRTDRGVIVEVTDTGPGIPEESRTIIFEAFRQVGISAGGTGLGLSIVQRLVRLLEGSVELESELGRGSTFRVCLGQIAVQEAAE